MAEPGGFYYMRNRYYDPEKGRFISEDPIGFAGGMVELQDYGDAVGKVLKSANLYHYTFNNPVNFIDPFGLLVWGVHGDASGGFIGALDGTIAVLFEGAFNDVALALDLEGTVGPQVSADLGAGVLVAPYAEKIADLAADSV